MTDSYSRIFTFKLIILLFQIFLIFPKIVVVVVAVAVTLNCFLRICSSYSSPVTEILLNIGRNRTISIAY